ncbi:MAG: tellurite resistance/C4-dicarboxylate transporter family protein [Streptosporangiaceae bacterium]
MPPTEPAQPPVTGARGRTRGAVRTLHPGYFALVMASGIISIAMRNHHAYALSVVLMWVAGIAWAVLVVLHAWRLVAFRAMLAADLTDPSRGFGFFTFVAGTDVLGTRLVLDGYRLAGGVLLAAGWLGWLLLGYVVPWTAVLGHARRPVVQYANGTWFIWVVASQSVAVLAAALAPAATTGRSELALLAVFSWSVGVFLYAAAGIFVAARLMLYDLRPADLTQPYWVSMGATAITVVAGARIMHLSHLPVVAAMRGLIGGASVAFWAFGTWLIPALVAAGWWRHVAHHIPVRYDPTWWSVVFPLGMYGVAGQYLGQADHLPLIQSIGANESWVALAAWALTFLAMMRHLYRTLLSPRPGDPAGAATR